MHEPVLVTETPTRHEGLCRPPAVLFKRFCSSAYSASLLCRFVVTAERNTAEVDKHLQQRFHCGDLFWHRSGEILRFDEFARQVVELNRLQSITADATTATHVKIPQPEKIFVELMVFANVPLI